MKKPIRGCWVIAGTLLLLASLGCGGDKGSSAAGSEFTLSASTVKVPLGTDLTISVQNGTVERIEDNSGGALTCEITGKGTSLRIVVRKEAEVGKSYKLTAHNGGKSRTLTIKVEKPLPPTEPPPP